MKVFKCPHCWGLGREPPDLFNGCVLCQGRGQIEDVQLSMHFWLSEWCRAHEGCPNDPPADAPSRARLTLKHVVEPGRARLAEILAGKAGAGLTVVDGYRCAQLDVLANRGDKKWLTCLSAYQTGSALDLKPADPRVPLRTLFDALREAAQEWDQIIALGGCVHVAYEGPGGGNVPMAPGYGSKRKQLLVRLPVPGGFRYADFDGSDKQWSEIV